MPQRGGDDLERYTLLVQQGGSGVAQGVETPPTDSGLLADPVVELRQIVGIHGCADWRGEDEACLPPASTRRLAFRVLKLSLPDERGDAMPR